jgi:hypothetical protein
VFAFQEDGNQWHLLEIGSGKQLALTPGAIEAVESRVDSETNASYLVLMLESGAQLVLSRQGFAFSPDFQNTGPMELPVTVFCLADFHQLYAKLRHLVDDHPEEPRQALDLVMLLIALLDGGRNVGLDVESETRRVEKILEGLESGTRPE